MNIADALRNTSDVLERASVADSRREAASLLAFALTKTSAFLIAHPEYELADDEAARFDAVIARRANREPFQYITGRQEFYRLEFEVTPDVLIPRPETEILVESAIIELRKLNEPNFCEVGVGSGCISVSILKNVTTVTAIATDISEKAITVARHNAVKHGVADRLTFINGDLFAGIDQRFDLIVSNPPYVPDGDLAEMQKEVRDFEPHNALFAGLDGLDIVRRIIAEAPQHLNPSGLMLIEIGIGQAEILREQINRSIWNEPDIIRDLQGIDRILQIRLR